MPRLVLQGWERFADVVADDVADAVLHVLESTGPLADALGHPRRRPIHYTLTLGVAELYDYEWFFGGFHRTIDSDAAAVLGARKPGQKVVVYPRRSSTCGTRAIS